MLDGHNGFFYRIHAANGRTEIVFSLPGPYALDKCESVGFFTIRGPKDLSGIGAAGGKDPLELQTAYDIGGCFVSELRFLHRIVEAKTRGENHRPCLNFHCFIFLLVVYSVGGTNLLADAATIGFEMDTIIPVDDDESYATISLRCNDFVIIPKGFPKAKDRIQSAGFKILEVETTEFQKMDGGLTCLSLLF